LSLPGARLAEKIWGLTDILENIYQQSSSLAEVLLLKNHLPMPAGIMSRINLKVCYKTTDGIK